MALQNSAVSFFFFTFSFFLLQWLPLLKDGILQTGDFNLPVLLEHPPPSYNFVPTDFFPPVTSSKWLDNRKGLFTICVDTVSSIHTEVMILL